MKSVNKNILLLYFLICGCAGLHAQDINGVWKGNYGRSLFMMQPNEVVAELYLANDSIITGLTHAYYKKNQYEHHKISGKFRKADSVLIFTEDNIINYDFGRWGASICEGRYTMKLFKEKARWLLSGRWKDKEGGLFACPATSVWLEKKIPDSLQEKDSVVAAAEVAMMPQQLKRATDIQKLLEITPAERDSIKIELYDNGEIDDDSVTVYLNDSLCINKLKLSAVPARVYVSLNPHVRIQKLTLAAENLGRIPPNTALMVVTTRRQKRYEIYLSSSMKKNAAVEFFLMD